MATKVLSQNLQEGLGLAHMPTIVEQVARYNPDVAIFTDAYSVREPAHNKVHGASPERVEEAKEAFERQGYRVHAVEYGALDNWPQHDRNIMLLERDALYVKEQLFANRYGLIAKMPNDITLFGLHGDDRSAFARRLQYRALLRVIDSMDGEAAALGDYNETHGNGPRLIDNPRNIKLAERAFLGAAVLAGKLPLKLRGDERQKKLQHAADYCHRLAPMVTGQNLAELKAAGLRDVDQNHLPTFRPVERLSSMYQLDHCMVSEGVSSLNFQVLPKLRSIDHQAFIVDLFHR